MTSADKHRNLQERAPFSFQVGGSLEAEQPSYIERAADQVLLSHLLQGDYCFVFNTRQMGKSSLRVQAMQQLRLSGVSCAVIDPQLRGTSITENQWYAGTIRMLWLDLGLGTAKEFSHWWQGPEAQMLSPVERFADFVTKVLLPTKLGSIVIFVEEVDNLLSLDFDTDSFFGLIRSFHEHRSEQADLSRLCFCFLGVATPYDLIRRHHHSAFNIGYAVDLNGFSFDEARHFLKGLEGVVSEPEATLHAVLSWSGGQPFLTQKLLQLVVSSAERGHGEPLPPSSMIERLVRGHVIDNWETQDVPPHLRTIRDRLLRSDERERGQLLEMARQVLGPEGLEADGSREQLMLRLTGLVVQRGGYLQIYNRIYEDIFNIDWIEQQLDALRPAIYREAFHAWKQAPSEERQAHLISGAALLEAQEWARAKRISREDREFIESCRAEEEVLRLADKDKEIARSKMNYLRRWTLTLAVFSVIALVSLLLLLRQTKLANVRQLLASARTSELSGDYVYGMLQVLSVSRVSRLFPFSKERLAAEGLLMGVLNNSGNREVNLLAPHLDMVRALAIDDDNAFIVAGLLNGNLVIWDASSGGLIRKLEGHKCSVDYPDDCSVNSIVISHDGRNIVSGGSDGRVLIWDATSGDLITELDDHLGSVKAVAISHNGRDIISGGVDGKIIISDTSSGKVRRQLHDDSDNNYEIFSVAISRDGRYIVSGGSDGKVRIWDASSLKLIRKVKAEASDSWIYSVAISHDGRRIVSGSADRTVRIWDTTSGDEPIRELTGHVAAVYSVALSSDSRRIVSSSEDGTLRIWDTTSGEAIGEPLRGHDAAVLSLAISRDDRRIVSGSRDRTVRIWDATSGGGIREPFRGHDKWVNSVAISHDGRRLVSGADDEKLMIWDASGGERIRELKGHAGQVMSVAISRDGRRIVSGSKDKKLLIWDASSGDPIRELNGHRSSVMSVAISRDGSRIVSGGFDGKVLIWDASTGDEPIRELESRGAAVYSVAISSDGSRIVWGSLDRTVRIWDPSSVEPIRKLNGHTSRVASVAISSDGSRIVSGGFDGKVLIWDASTGDEPIRELESRGAAVYSVAISSDGSRIVSGSLDQTVRIWDASSGELLRELEGHRGFVTSVAISSDGSRIVSGSEDSTVRQWIAGDLQALTALACKKVELHPMLQAPKGIFLRNERIEVARSASNACRNTLGQ